MRALAPPSRSATKCGCRRQPPLSSRTDSGAVSVAGMARARLRRERSGSITLRDLGADLQVKSGSGAVSANGVADRSTRARRAGG